jgi:uncharacterized membrane protein YfhO
VLSERPGINTESFTVAADTPGLLVRSETWAPGWQVRVDGQPAALLRVDCALQGVALPAGQHQVDFEYAPAGWVIGRWLSLGTALVVLGVVAVMLLRWWRAQRRERLPAGG